MQYLCVTIPLAVRPALLVLQQVVLGSLTCTQIQVGGCRTHKGGSGTNKPAQELTRRDRKTAAHPAPPAGDQTQAFSQPAEFVIPNGGGFGRGACPLKLKKMAHTHRSGRRIVVSSACAVAQNQRTRVNVDCGRWTYCVVYGTWRTQTNKQKKQKRK